MTAQPYAPDRYRPLAPSPIQARPIPVVPAQVRPIPAVPSQDGPAPARPVAPRSRRTGRTLLVVGALLAVVAGLAVLALRLLATPTVAPATVQDEIVRATQAAVQVAPAGVRCPEGIAVQAGGMFTCTGTVDGQPVTWWVHQNDDRGDLRITSDRLLRVDALEQTVATEVGADLRTTLTVHCGAADRTVLRNTPGQEIDCLATKAASGAVTPLTVNVDENGAVAYRLH